MPSTFVWHWQDMELKLQTLEVLNNLFLQTLKLLLMTEFQILFCKSHIKIPVSWNYEKKSSSLIIHLKQLSMKYNTNTVSIQTCSLNSLWSRKRQGGMEVHLLCLIKMGHGLSARRSFHYLLCPWSAQLQ